MTSSDASRGTARLAAALVAGVWLVVFLAGWNVLQSSELSGPLDDEIADACQSLVLPLLLVAGTLLAPRVWLLAVVPPQAALALLVVVDEPANTWLPGAITTAGWILLPILPLATIALGGMLGWMMRRWRRRHADS